MARMTLRAVHTDGERRRWKLCRRIVEENRIRHIRGPHLHHPAEAGAQGASAPPIGLVESRAGGELVDAAWLYAWSRASLRDRAASVVPHAIAS